jgi:hypothetical protein
MKGANFQMTDNNSSKTNPENQESPTRKKWNVSNLTGKRFGRWVVISKDITPRRYAHWICHCDCGVKKSVSAYNLTRGGSASCGCLRIFLSGRNTKITHGCASEGKRTTEYKIWNQIKSRCAKPNSDKWKDYGGRGITVCERWKVFESFLADMGLRPSPKHSIDRIDNDKGYSHENCRWASKTVQRINSRISSKNKSGFKGIYFERNYRHNCWRATIRTFGVKKRKHFQTKEEAIKQRLEWEKLYHEPLLAKE